MNGRKIKKYQQKTKKKKKEENEIEIKEKSNAGHKDLFI